MATVTRAVKAGEVLTAAQGPGHTWIDGSRLNNSYQSLQGMCFQLL